MSRSIVDSFRTGFENRIKTLRKSTHTWELYAIIILIAVIIVLITNFLIPTFFGVDESEWVPDQQEINYMFFFNESSEYEGRVEITCEPSGKYIKTNSRIDCTYVFSDRVGQDKLRFSENTIDNLRGSNFVIYDWTDLRLDSYIGRVGSVAFYDFYEDSGDEHFITGEFTLPTPSISGNQYLTIETGSQLDMRSGTGELVTIYSDSEVANFEYRESVAPLEQLVVIGLLIALLRLCLTFSERIVKKTTNSE
ncbi:hypothetical protein [Halorubrum ezzemoulense]|uniref:hypothetical protein n=1 Tax=Halorubrum ezzemoulense TaxID=337243 RepID=UPI001181848D|nr:hypothetical protein [Halorubrum ezzemoulense]